MNFNDFSFEGSVFNVFTVYTDNDNDDDKSNIRSG